MNSDNKQIRDVAGVAARIMAGLPAIEEELKGGQVKIDKNHNGKIDGQDFKILRGEKKVKEEVEELDEVSLKTATSAYVARMGREDNKSPLKAVKTIDNIAKKHGVVGVARAAKAADKKYGLNDPVHNKRKDFVRGVMSNVKEDIESIDEVKMADLPSTKVQGRAYGASKPEPHPLDVMKGPSKSTMDTMAKQKKDKKFSEMVNLYQNGGMKSFLESLEKEEEDKLIDEVSKEIADYTMDVIDAGEYTEVTIGEEASQDEFNAEIEKAKAKSQGKDKAEVAKGAVQAVKQEGTEITDEMIFEVLESAGIDFESLNDEELQEVTNEAYEILDELSKNTLGSYIKKSNFAGGMADFKHGRIADKRGDSKEKTSLAATSTKRQKGISTAVNKLSKEEVEQVEERHMTDAEMSKREKIVKSMKKGLSGFKDRYGDRAKNVMYATANKNAMKS
jgi:hypothetical protein